MPEDRLVNTRAFARQKESTYDVEQEELAHFQDNVDHAVRHVAVHDARVDVEMPYDAVFTLLNTRESARNQVDLVFRCLIRVVRLDELPIIVVVPARLALERTHPDHPRGAVILVCVCREHWVQISILEPEGWINLCDRDHRHLDGLTIA